MSTKKCDVQFLRYVARWTDEQTVERTDGKSDIYREVGAPPKNLTITVLTLISKLY